MCPLVLVAALVYLCCAVRADGFVVLQWETGDWRESATPGAPASDAAWRPSETDQRAVIVWRDGRETLLLQVGLGSPSTDVAWVVPVPSLPVQDDVFLANREFLATAFAETEPVRRRALRMGNGQTALSSLWLVLPLAAVGSATLSSSRASGTGGEDASGLSVELRGQFPLGPYEIALLQAARADDLDRWLGQHGFVLPQRVRADFVSLAEDYIARGWCFVAARAAREEPEATQASVPAAATRLSDLPPLGLSFAAEAPVYPLKITRLSAPPRMALRLVVLAPEAVRVSGVSEMHVQDLAKAARPLGPGQPRASSCGRRHSRLLHKLRCIAASYTSYAAQPLARASCARGTLAGGLALFRDERYPAFCGRVATGQRGTLLTTDRRAETRQNQEAMPQCRAEDSR